MAVKRSTLADAKESRDWLEEGCRHVVIGRDKRDDVWIVSRTPTMAQADLDRLIAFVGTQGV